MQSVNYKFKKTNNILTSRAGLVTVPELINRLQLSEVAERHLPAAGSNRGYRPSGIFDLMMLLFHNGGKCLDDISDLVKEKPLLKLFGCNKLPSARTLGNFLRRTGSDSKAMAGLTEINRHLLAAGLGGRKQVTLDIDATVIESNKREAKWTYKKHKGYTPMVGHITETDQVVEVEFRDGNEPPNKQNLEFIKRCETALPEGVAVTKVRIDAAGYQSEVINYLMQNDKKFAIRAKMDATLKESISSIKERDWQPLIMADGTESRTEQVARTVHTMCETEKAFTLVVQKKRIDEGENVNLETFIDGEDNSVSHGIYIYRAIATNMESKSDSDIVQWYNLRGETSENRIKELRSDFSGANLPCGDFHANAAWFKLSSLAYNLFALMRMVLPMKWATARAPTIRMKLYAVAGQIVRHARQWTLNLGGGYLEIIEEAVLAIRSYPLRI